MPQQWSVPVGPPERAGEGAPRRNYKAQDKEWVTPAGKEHVTTVYELVKDAVKEYGPKPCLGQRKFIDVHNEKKVFDKEVDGEIQKVTKLWTYFELGPYDWWNFEQTGEAVQQLSSALRYYGIRPGKDKFQIYAKTCREWLTTALGCMCISVPIVTAYDTLGLEGLEESMLKTGTSGILCDKDNIPTLAKALEKDSQIRLVVVRDHEGKPEGEQLEALESIKKKGVNAIFFSEFFEKGKANPSDPVPPKPEDLCCIMYTSGSTGPPKGVTLTHKALVAAVAGATGSIGHETINPGDVFIGILPLAHILEVVVELSSLVWGAATGYGTPKTLTDLSMRNCKGDIKELRPTLVAAVPAVFESIKKGIVSLVNKQSGLKQKLFWGAYYAKAFLDSHGLPSPLFKQLIFKKVSEALGGRVRYFFYGGAALSTDTKIFLQTLIGPALMGYGLTETTAMAAIMSPANYSIYNAAEIVPTVTMKLVDVPDAGYFAKNNQGEIWIRGPSVSNGYFENPKETEEAFTSDGWFMTGDVGEWTSNGSISVIDRKKNLVKTSSGEYIAVERLESLYRSNDLVNNLCMLADGGHSKPIAVIVPMESTVKDLCKEKGIEFPEHSISESKEITDLILKSLQQTAKKSGMRPAETIAGIALSDEEWTPQNGFVSSAQKLQRRKIRDANKVNIEKAFKKAL